MDSMTPPPVLHAWDRFYWKRSLVVAFVMVLAIILRLAAVASFPGDPASEREILHTEIADSWRNSFSYSYQDQPTAAVMPLYSVLVGLCRLAAPETWKPVLFIQALLGVLGVWLAHRIAWRVTRIPAIAWGVLFLCAFYPPLIFQCGRLEPDVLYQFLLLFSFWLLTFVFRESTHLAFFMVAAVVLVFGIYTTPKVLPLIPILAFWAGLKAFDRPTGALGALALCLACILSLMPWIARNFISMGGFIPLTTSMAYSLSASLEQAGAEAGVDSPTPSYGQDEATRYQSALSGSYRLVGGLGGSGLGRLAGGVPSFWVTDYASTFPPGADGDPPAWVRSVGYRAVSLTIVLTFAVLAVVGFCAGIFRFHAWMLTFFLGVASLFEVLFGQAPERHLVYWPFYSIFVAWGGTVLLRLFFSPAFQASKTAWAKNRAAKRAANPPSSFAEGGLEPIRSARSGPLLPGAPNHPEPPPLEPILFPRGNAEPQRLTGISDWKEEAWPESDEKKPTD